MKISLVLGILLVLITNVRSQDNDSIIFQKGHFLNHGKVLRSRDLLEITNSNPEANLYIKKSIKMRQITSIVCLSGIGVILGGSLAYMVTNNYSYFQAGNIFGSVALASCVPMYLIYTSREKKGVEIYNSNLTSTKIRDDPSVCIGFKNTQLGIFLNF